MISDESIFFFMKMKILMGTACWLLFGSDLVWSQNLIVTPPPVDVEQSTMTIGASEYFALTVHAEMGFNYTLQTLSEAGVWVDSLDFDGLDDDVIIPLVTSSGGQPMTSAPPPLTLFKIQPVAAGGVLLHWESPATNELVSYFDNSIPNFLSSPDGFPPFSHETASNLFLFVSTGPVVSQMVGVSNPLGPDDTALLQAFQATYSSLTLPSANSALNLGL